MYRLSRTLTMVLALSAVEVELGDVVPGITTQPNSTSALINECATFYCEGTGEGINWHLNELPVQAYQYIPTNQACGSNCWKSTLDIPALEANDNMTVQCVTTTVEEKAYSRVVHFNVLGIGNISWLHFSSKSLCATWGMPFVSSDVLDLKFTFYLIGNDTWLSHNTSLTNFCPFIHLPPCGLYKMSIVPYSTAQGYIGPSKSITEMVTGGSFSWDGQNCTVEIKFFADRFPEATFACKLKVTAYGATCPGQTILILCGSYTNPSATSIKIGPQAIEPLLLRREKSIVINVPGLPLSEHLFCDIALKSVDESKADSILQNFDSFSTRRIDVTTEENSAGILVTVTAKFEPATTVWGCKIVFTSSSLKEFSVMIQRENTFSSVPSNTYLIRREALSSGTTYILDVLVYDCITYNCDTVEPAITKRLALVFSWPSNGNFQESTSTDHFMDPSPSDTSSSEVVVNSLSAIVALLSLLVAVLMVINIYQCQQFKKFKKSLGFQSQRTSVLDEPTAKKENYYYNVENLSARNSQVERSEIALKDIQLPSTESLSEIGVLIEGPDIVCLSANLTFAELTMDNSTLETTPEHDAREEREQVKQHDLSDALSVEEKIASNESYNADGKHALLHT